jgi:hypothetical protein
MDQFLKPARTPVGKEFDVKRYVIGLAFFSTAFASTIASADGPADGSPKGKATGAASVLEAKKEKAVPFYGFAFDFTMADSSGLNSIGENYRNDLNFYFEPTWNVGPRFLRNTAFKSLMVAGRFAVTQNLSGTEESNFGSQVNSGPETPCFNGTPSTQGGTINPSQVPYCHPAANNRRTDYSDIWLTLRAPKIYTIPVVGININPSIRFIFPTSLESRFATLRMGWTTSLALGRSFWKDRISVGAGFGITKNFHDKTTQQIYASNGSTGGTTTQGGNFYDQAAANGISNFYVDPSRTSNIGGYNVSYAMLGSFTAAAHINDKWSFDVLYILIGNFTYGPDQCNVSIGNGQTTNVCANNAAVMQGQGISQHTNHDAQVFWATLAYQPLDYLGISLAWINWAPLTYSNSTYRQGIISTNYDAYTTVQLGVTVTLDKLGAKFLKN